MILSRWFHDASPINIEHPWKWFFLISISSLPASAGNTMQLEKPINHHVEYINWPIKIKNAAWGIYVLQCSTPLGSQKAVKTSDVWDHLLCHRSRRLTHSWDGEKKNLFKKKLSRCQVFFTSFKMFFCWAWCDCESFLKGKLQASYVQTSKLVGCIGYHDQICSIVWFFLFKTPTKLSYPTCLWIWGMVWEMRYTYMICICIFMDHDN